MCWVLGEGCLSMEAWGFWWATWAAAGGKSLSPRAMTPEINTVGLGGLEDKKEKTWTTTIHREEHVGEADGEPDFVTT